MDYRNRQRIEELWVRVLCRRDSGRGIEIREIGELIMKEKEEDTKGGRMRHLLKGLGKKR